MHNDKAIQTELLAFKNRIRGAKTPSRVILNVRDDLSPSAYSAAIKWLHSQPLYKKDILNSGYPNSIRAIISTSLLNTTSVQHELRWAASSLAAHSANLTLFVEQSLAFQRAFLLDDHLSCRQVLDGIRTHFGASLWLIENEIAFLQTAQGTEEQISYTKRTREEIKDRGILDYLVGVFSARSESSNPLRIIEHYSGRLSSVSLPDDLKAFMRFHMGLIGPLQMEDIMGVLRWESASSVIDYYETFLAMIPMIISMGYKTLFATATTSLRLLQGKVSDPRLDLLLFELGGKEPPIHPAEPLLIDASNKFLTGNFAQAADQAIQALNTYPEIHGLREIASRSFAIQSDASQYSDTSLSMRLIKLMSQLVSRQALDDSDMLINIAFSFQGHSWSKSLLSYMSKVASPDPLETGAGLVHLAASGAPLINPLQLGDFPALDVRRLVAGRIKRIYGECQTSVVASKIAKEVASDLVVESFVWEEWTLIEAECDIRDNNLAAALDKSIRLDNSSRDCYKQNAARIRSHTLFHLHSLAECVDFITKTYVNYPHYEPILPIRNVVHALDKELRQQFKADISLAIILDIHCRYVNSDFTFERNDAYEDFLLANGISKPSEIESLLQNLDINKAIYYLRHICVESVMDTAIVFDTSKDIRDERVAVCRLLIRLDSANTEFYQSEIKDVVRRSMIKQRTREVEQSKIYVDVDSLRKAVDKNIKESFGRYISLVRQGVAADTVQVIDQFREKTELGDIEELLKLVLPQNEVGSLLRLIVIHLRDSFVSSTEYGLDGYLSSRIRHGTLQGQLRSPVEAAHLITNRDSTTGLYKSNQHWLDLVSCKDENVKATVSNRLTQFSEGFDDLVREIKDEWIQIKKSHEDTGLFSFVLTETHISLIASEITNETSIEQFLDYVFDLFRGRLEDNLDVIRRRLDNEAKRRFNVLMTALQTDLEALDGLTNTTDLTNAITTARTELQITLDRIIEWFRLSNSIQKEPFQIDEAINVAAESVRTPSNHFDFSLHVSDDNTVLFEGRLLVVLVDILFIVFENIVRHSGIVDKPFAFINMSFTQDAMELRIENEVASSVPIQESANKLESIKDAINDEQRRDAVATEGGTGFLKIRKFLKFDIGVKPVLDFGFTLGSRFYVQFSLPTREAG